MKIVERERLLSRGASWDLVSRINEMKAPVSMIRIDYVLSGSSAIGNPLFIILLFLIMILSTLALPFHLSLTLNPRTLLLLLIFLSPLSSTFFCGCWLFSISPWNLTVLLFFVGDFSDSVRISSATAALLGLMGSLIDLLLSFPYSYFEVLFWAFHCMILHISDPTH